jgi:hypothetical protein
MELKWPDVVPMWWGYLWRSLAYTTGAAVLIGLAAGFVGAHGGDPSSSFVTLAIWLSWLPLSMLAMKNALEHNWSELSAVLKPSAAP